MNKMQNFLISNSTFDWTIFFFITFFNIYLFFKFVKLLGTCGSYNKFYFDYSCHHIFLLHSLFCFFSGLSLLPIFLQNNVEPRTYTEGGGKGPVPPRPVKGDFPPPP